jgi:hypothetical protein
VLWVLAFTPGIAFIVHSSLEIFHERAEGRRGAVLYGQDAVGWGWVGVSAGIWLLGYGCSLLTQKIVPKWIFYCLSAIPFTVGLVVLANCMMKAIGK